MANAAKPEVSRRAIAALAAILVFTVWWRGHTFGPTIQNAVGFAPYPACSGDAEPLDCDEALYGYMARRMIAGDRLYAELSENKPPGGYWIYATAVALGGASELTIRLMAVPIVLATVSLVWWIGLRLGGPWAAGLSALLYALLSADPFMYGNGSQFELSMNLFSVLGLAALVEAARRPWRAPLVVLSGVAIGLASLVKQVAVLHVLVALAAIVMMPWAPGRPAHGASSSEPVPGGKPRLLGGWLLGFSAVWLATVLVLVVQGTASDAYDEIVRHGRAMATDLDPEPGAPPGWIRWLTGNADPQGNLPPPFGSTDYLVWWGQGTWPIWLGAVPGFLWLAFARPTFERLLLLAWSTSAAVQVALPGLYWPHYYLLATPALALIVGVAWEDQIHILRLKDRGPGAWALVGGLSGAVVGLGLLQTGYYLFVPPEELTRRHKGGAQWIALRRAGEELAERLRHQEGADLQVWGWQSPLLFYSGLEAPSRYLFTNNLMRDFADREHPIVGPRLEEMMRSLSEDPPALVMAGYEPFPQLQAFLSEHYFPSAMMPSRNDGRGLWVRKDLWAEFEMYNDRITRERPSGEAPPRSYRGRPGIWIVEPP